MPTFGDQVRQFGGVPVGGVFSTHSKSYFVYPGTGSNSNSGLKPTTPWATLAQAKSAMDADKNAVVYLVAEDNSASGTTNRISAATFDWNVDGSIIQGVCAGGMIGSRARISNTADATDVSPLMTWSASNASMRNVHVLYSEADAGDLGCFSVSGERNYFYRCHFGGIGDTTQDAANAYSLMVSGDENLFEECVIGIDTIGRGSAANSELRFESQATRNIFKNCLFLTYADAATHQFILLGASSLDRWALFDNCTFINSVGSGATTMTEAIDGNASQGGTLIFKDCTLIGCTEWEAGDIGVGQVAVMGASGTAATTGIAVEPAV
jgi:hypothetical protein